MSADKLAAQIPDGSVILTDVLTSEPFEIFKALDRRCEADNIRDCKLFTAIDLYPYKFITDKKYQKNILLVSMFSSGLTRNAVQSGVADFIPFNYNDFPRMFTDYVDADVFVLKVSKMDEDGYFSAGICGSFVNVFLSKVKKVYVECCDKMPYCRNASKVHISQIAGICESHDELISAPAPKLDDVSLKIGSLIAERIPDGACLQLGIGPLPDAIGVALRDKKHLGIHSEMLTESMIDLIECGAVDNSLKETYTGCSVATFAATSARIYKHLAEDDNIILLPVEEANNPYNIAKNSNMVSVNAALEVDIFGQTCAESVGHRIISGTGGQLDFVRGAVLSKGGQSFIAFPSTAKGGQISRIKPLLSPGAQVTTPRNEVDMVVTEYGIAKLRGKTLWERAENLISIAHPDFRDELRFECRKLGFNI